MGHWEHEWEHYNPVIDKYTYGPEKYVIDEKDRQEAYEKRSRADEFSTIKSYIESIEDGYDYATISKVRRKIDEARYLDAYQKSDLRRDLNYRVELMKRIEQNERNAAYERSKRETEKREKEIESSKEAKENWKKRYKRLSLFGKIRYFRQRPSTINVFDTSAEEINNLGRRR